MVVDHGWSGGRGGGGGGGPSRSVAPWTVRLDRL